MYNNDRKQEFIEKEFEIRKLDYVKRNYSWAFNVAEPYEEKYKKDVANFSYEEIISMYGDLKVSLYTLLHLNNLLKGYSYKIVKDKSGFLLFNEGELKRLFIQEKRILLTKNEVLNLSDTLLNSMDKFCVYGMFNGIKGKDYCELGYSSMDGSDDSERSLWLADIKNDGRIQLKGRKFFADDILYQFAKDASEANYMQQLTKEGVYKKIILESGTKIIFKRPFTPLGFNESKENSQIDRVKNRFTKSVMNSLDMKGVITPLDFYWSGLIYSIQNKALPQKGALKTLDDYLDFFNEDGCEDIQEQYNINLTIRRLKAKLERYL